MQRADVHGKLHVLSTSIAAKLAETLQVDIFLPAISARY